ncbi:hypothetical protein ZWY2020_011678 [Hordeum vulgare]|nr:hypothetical protein ZWY2020_011678 [Hordeum vulgare]
MEITVHSSKLVKPAYGDDGRAGDVIPLSVFDRVNYNEYIFYVYAFHPPAPPSVALEAGLARALAAYPEWAGRLGDGSAIVLCDSGARFVEATADSELSSGAVALLATGNKALMSLYPSCDGAEELLLATRGVAINPVPVHDRTSLFARRGPPQVRFEHRGVELKPRDEKPGSCGGDGIVHAGDEVVVHKVHFSREWIMELKSLVSEGDPRSYTTLQCLAAHLWRCVTKARGLDGRQATRIRIAVNGRTRMRRPRVPEGYTGSVVLWAWPTTTARQLLDRPLRYAVELISEEVARMDDAYFRSFIDFAASGAVEEEKLVPTADAAEVRLGTNVDLDSLLAIPFPKLDLGCGAPFFFRPGYSPAPVDGAIYVVKSFVGDGSVDAYVPLCSRAMDNFKKCCYSLPVPVPVAARL